MIVDNKNRRHCQLSLICTTVSHWQLSCVTKVMGFQLGAEIDDDFGKRVNGLATTQAISYRIGGTFLVYFSTKVSIIWRMDDKLHIMMLCVVCLSLLLFVRCAMLSPPPYPADRHEANKNEGTIIHHTPDNIILILTIHGVPHRSRIWPQSHR